MSSPQYFDGERPLANPLLQIGPLVFMGMSLGFGLVLLGCVISDARHD